MPLTKIILSYVLTAAVFFAIDMLWLGLIAKGFYNKHLASFLSPNVNWFAAIIFYLVFIAGILVFVVFPAHEKGSLSHAALYGALFGIVTYATYDLTNMATLRNWPLTIVVVDIAWGAILTALVSISGWYILKFLS